MSDEKIDYVYKQMKEREERMKVIEKRRKTVGKVIEVLIIVGLVVLFIYVGVRLLSVSIDLVKIIKSDDLKIAVISLMTFILGIFALSMGFFKLWLDK